LGKTVPSFRIALEVEIARWRGFRKALESDKEREAFDELMDMCRNNAMAAGSACNPIVFEPMVMSIMLAHQSSLRDLGDGLHEVFWRKICIDEAMTVSAEG